MASNLIFKRSSRPEVLWAARMDAAMVFLRAVSGHRAEAGQGACPRPSGVSSQISRPPSRNTPLGISLIIIGSSKKWDRERAHPAKRFSRRGGKCSRLSYHTAKGDASAERVCSGENRLLDRKGGSAYNTISVHGNTSCRGAPPAPAAPPGPVPCGLPAPVYSSRQAPGNFERARSVPGAGCRPCLQGPCRSLHTDGYPLADHRLVLRGGGRFEEGTRWKN